VGDRGLSSETLFGLIGVRWCLVMPIMRTHSECSSSSKCKSQESPKIEYRQEGAEFACGF
jgi:hypothetical protein